MWVVVFIVLGVLGLVVLGLLAWRIVRKAGALLGEVADVTNRLSAIGETVAELAVLGDEDDGKLSGSTNPDPAPAT